MRPLSLQKWPEKLLQCKVFVKSREKFNFSVIYLFFALIYQKLLMPLFFYFFRLNQKNTKDPYLSSHESPKYGRRTNLRNRFTTKTSVTSATCVTSAPLSFHDQSYVAGDKIQVSVFIFWNICNFFVVVYLLIFWFKFLYFVLDCKSKNVYFEKFFIS